MGLIWKEKLRNGQDDAWSYGHVNLVQSAEFSDLAGPQRVGTWRPHLEASVSGAASNLCLFHLLLRFFFPATY